MGLLLAALDTVTDYIRRARVLLQDTGGPNGTAPFRYSDTELIDALNSAGYDARRLRPDLFVSTAAPIAIPYFIANDGTSVNVDPQFRMAFLYYMCAQAQMRDEENTQDARAAEFMTLWQEIMTGTKA